MNTLREPKHLFLLRGVIPVLVIIAIAILFASFLLFTPFLPVANGTTILSAQVTKTQVFAVEEPGGLFAPASTVPRETVTFMLQSGYQMTQTFSCTYYTTGMVVNVTRGESETLNDAISNFLSSGITLQNGTQLVSVPPPAPPHVTYSLTYVPEGC